MDALDQLGPSAAAGTPAQPARRDASAAFRRESRAADARRLPMLWRVFAANAAVFVLAFALLALSPVTIHARIRLVELVVLAVGLVAMLIIDLMLIRPVLAPLRRLVRVMGAVDMLRPGQRADGFERSGTEVRALAAAFNEMLDRLETERRDSFARALAAQEAARLRISRELHDDVAQTLAAVALRAEYWSGRTDTISAGRVRTELAELGDLVQRSLEDLRRISRELRPEALDDLGLVNALIALCSRVEQRSGIAVRHELDVALPVLDPEVELAIYRVAQEALTNAIRHSGASAVDVSLRLTDRVLTLSISDDGRGLPRQVVHGGGITGMRERAILIGADFEMRPAGPSGVVVNLTLPLDGERV